MIAASGSVIFVGEGTENGCGYPDAALPESPSSPTGFHADTRRTRRIPSSTVTGVECDPGKGRGPLAIIGRALPHSVDPASPPSNRAMIPVATIIRRMV